MRRILLIHAEPELAGATITNYYPHRIYFQIAFVLVLGACAVDPATEASATPEIVQVFACSDYCPGPREQYMKTVYEGVSDAAECRKLGGRPYTYFGWGQRTVCEVQ